MAKFGDIILNHYAGERNPIKYTMFIKYSGRYAKCIDMDGNDVRYDKKDIINNPEFEIIDNIQIKEQFIKATIKYLNKQE